ncbi:MAG: TonB-dependent receptor [Pseudomonadota bacterium]
MLSLRFKAAASALFSLFFGLTPALYAAAPSLNQIDAGKPSESSVSVIPAETLTPPTEDQVVREVFEPQEFDRFAPRTALDIVQQIPGFSIREGGGDRGLGQADTNVLINSRRVSGKSNGPVDALRRIPATEVLRLELIDGASMDLPGLSGQVLNVLTKQSGGISGRFVYSPQFRDTGTSFRWGNGEVSIAGGSEKTEWTLSFENDQRRFGDEGPEFVFDGEDQLISSRFESRTETVDIPRLSGSYSRTASNGSVLNATGEFQGFLSDVRETSERTLLGDAYRVRSLSETEDEFSLEVGADYEFAVGDGGLKFIGLYRYENSPIVNGVRFDFADGRPPTESVFDRVADEAEAILRTEYSFGGLGGDWQVALEGVNNYLETSASLFELDETGVFQSVELPGVSSRVEENRAELSFSHSRPLSSRLQLQSSLGVEYSEISQTGEFGLTRDFIRPKGLVSLDWEATDSLNISFKVERTVGQLNFFDFISSVNLNQERVNVTNVNLVPPQSWEFDIELNQSLSDYGSVTLRALARDISDIVDQIPIEGGGQAPGNIDSAFRYGASLDLTLLSDPVGWRGLRFDFQADFRDSEVIDPLTNQTRRFSDRNYFDLRADLRQDFFGTNWAAGFSWDYEENSPFVRLDEEGVSQFPPGFSSVFVENKDIRGLTIRARMANLFDRQNNFFRTIFDDRLTNDVAFREERFREFGYIFTFDIEGSF